MEETIKPDYEALYKSSQEEWKIRFEEIEYEFRNKLDSERNTKNAIIERQEKEIEFYKSIIKGILHIER